MRRNPLVLAGLCGSLLLASCGGVSTSSTHGETATSTPLISEIPSATEQAGGVAEFPEKDTELGSLTGKEQADWIVTLQVLGGADLSTIFVPGKEVLAQEPALPSITNGTNGKIAQDKAKSTVEAFWKQTALLQWAEEKGEMGFIATLSPAPLAPNVAQLLANGATVSEPNCDMYPSKITIVSVEEAIVAWFNDQGATTKGQYALVVTYPEGSSCKITVNQAGSSSTVDVSGTPTTVILGFTETNKAPLGDIVVPDAVSVCGTPNALPQYC